MTKDMFKDLSKKKKIVNQKEISMVFDILDINLLRADKTLKLEFNVLPYLFKGKTFHLGQVLFIIDSKYLVQDLYILNSKIGRDLFNIIGRQDYFEVFLGVIYPKGILFKTEALELNKIVFQKKFFKIPNELRLYNYTDSKEKRLEYLELKESLSFINAKDLLDIEKQSLASDNTISEKEVRII